MFDLAESFKRICDVEIAINASIIDNYGGYKDRLDIISKNEHLDGIRVLPLALALQEIRQKKYDLVGLDGVFDGDPLVMDACKNANIPFFCINGYPHNIDEPSDNILSFSHFLPQVQYKQKYPSEGHIKEIDWKNISEGGRSQGKNIFVYYPEMNEAKRYYLNRAFPARQNYISLIHRYEECNPWNFAAFKNVRDGLSKKSIQVENHSNLSQQEVFEKLAGSCGLLHLKHGDCPGISILEALILETPVFTMRSFVNASFNQEVLIHKINSFIADDLDELIDAMKNYSDQKTRCKKWDWGLGKTNSHIWNLTDFDRQKSKLERFFNRCLN